MYDAENADYYFRNLVKNKIGILKESLFVIGRNTVYKLIFQHCIMKESIHAFWKD